MALLTERRGAVLHLTLDRPDAYNAIDPELRDGLISALDAAEGDGARCIVIRGNGRGFSAGADMKSSNADLRGIDIMILMRGSTQRLVRAVLGCPVPIVTAVHGACAGVSLTLALASDYCIATEDARFIAAFVQRGLVPDGAATYLLPRLVGMGRAKRFLLLGETMTAAEAEAAGIVAEVVAPDQLATAADAAAARFAALPTRTLGYTKQMLARSFELDLDSTLLEERAGQALVGTTDDSREGIAAFREKRPPVYRGT
ncbi:MAG: enoyl-CoA hydratase [Acidimicrobiales bacterium]|nr:enoyl-CoA hydratase [Acidimicrobiales bacterium]